MYAQLKSEAIKSSMYWSRLYAKHIDTPRARFYLARKQWYDEMACKYHRLDVQATRENLAQQNIFRCDHDGGRILHVDYYKKTAVFTDRLTGEEYTDTVYFENLECEHCHRKWWRVCDGSTLIKK